MRIFDTSADGQKRVWATRWLRVSVDKRPLFPKRDSGISADSYCQCL